MNNPEHIPQPMPAPRFRRVSHVEFLRLYSDPKLTTYEIGARLGIDQSTVCKRAAARGLPKRGSVAQCAIHDTDLFRSMWDAGVQIADMATYFKVSTSTIKRYCKRLGVTPRGKGDWRRRPTVAAVLQDVLARQMTRTALEEQDMLLDAGMIERTNEARAYFRARGRSIL